MQNIRGKSVTTGGLQRMNSRLSLPPRLNKPHYGFLVAKTGVRLGLDLDVILAFALATQRAHRVSLRGLGWLRKLYECYPIAELWVMPAQSSSTYWLYYSGKTEKSELYPF